jgi:hypothetical protein
MQCILLGANCAPRGLENMTGQLTFQLLGSAIPVPGPKAQLCCMVYCFGRQWRYRGIFWQPWNRDRPPTPERSPQQSLIIASPTPFPPPSPAQSRGSSGGPYISEPLFLPPASKYSPPQPPLSLSTALLFHPIFACLPLGFFSGPGNRYEV